MHYLENIVREPLFNFLQNISFSDFFLTLSGAACFYTAHIVLCGFYADILLPSDHEYAVRIASSSFSLQEIIENPETLHFSEDLLKIKKKNI